MQLLCVSSYTSYKLLKTVQLFRPTLCMLNCVINYCIGAVEENRAARRCNNTF